MRTTGERVLDAGRVLIGTLIVYFALDFATIAGLEWIGRPVGAGRREAFGMVVVPFILIMIGMLQARIVFIIHLLGISFIWLDQWRFTATYDQAEHLGSLVKEQAINSFFSAQGVFLACAIFAGIWNGSIRFRGGDSIFKIPPWVSRIVRA